MAITANTVEQPAKRDTLASILLWIFILASLEGLGTLSYQIYISMIKGASAFYFIVSAIYLIMGIGNTAGLFMIIKWRMQGFRVIVGCQILRIILVLIQNTPIIPVILYAAVYLAILYLILQIPKGNKAWSHLV